MHPRGRKVRNIPLVSKGSVVAAGKEGNVTKDRTRFYSGAGNGLEKRAQGRRRE